MLRAYLRGAGIAARHWLLISGVFLAAASFGLTFAFASGAFLSDALEGSLATRTLFKELDPNVLVDLWFHHGEGLRMLAVVAVILAIGHTMAWWWLHAVMIVAVQGDGGTPPERKRRVLEVTPTIAQLFVLAVFAMLAWIACVVAPTYLAMRATRSDPSAWVWYRLWAAAAVVWLSGYVFLVAVHDHARIRACRTPHGAIACYRWALGFVLRGGERAFLLALLLQATALGLWAAYQLSSFAIPMTAVLGVTGSLAWGALYLWLRIWMRLWFFAAQSQLHS